MFAHMSIRTLEQARVDVAAPDDRTDTDDCPIRFFRGILCGLTLGSLFWGLVAVLLLID